jgi:uncharacterized membrane protein
MTDSMASMGHSEISFFETGIGWALPATLKDVLTTLSVHTLESVYAEAASDSQEEKTMISFLSIAGVLSIGLMIGVEFSVWVFINPISRKLGEQARADAIRLFAQKLGGAMPFWYAANMAILIADAALLHNQPGARLLGVAIAIWAAVIVLTLTFLVPINNRLARQDTGLSRDQADREHARWDTMHRARVVALATAFVLLLIGLRR